MLEAFDPYHKWLGIPPDERPPNHYRLLGIEPLESDADVIESAADQRMAHLRTFQSGNKAAMAQALLNEIAAAKVCLLNRAKKAAYDSELQEKLAAKAAVGGREGFDVAELLGQSAAERAPQSQPKTLRAKSGSKRVWVFAGVGVATLLASAAATTMLLSQGAKEPPRPEISPPPIAQAPAKPSAVESAVPPQPKPTSVIASAPREEAKPGASEAKPVATLSASEIASGRANLLTLLDPSRDTTVGAWVRSESGLATSVQTVPSLIVAPVIPEGSFELEAEFTRTEGVGSIALLFPVGNSYAHAEVCGFDDRYSGLGEIGGFSTNSPANPTKRPSSVSNNVLHKLAVRVRYLEGSEVEIGGTFDGAELFRWKGPVDSFKTQDLFWPMPRPASIALGTAGSQVCFHTVQLHMLDGHMAISQPHPSRIVVGPGVVRLGPGETFRFGTTPPISPAPVRPDSSGPPERGAAGGPPALTVKIAPPSVDEQKSLAAEIGELYKSDMPKAALARKLLDDGRSNTSNRAEQFVLLRRAGETARDAGDADLMLEAVDAIVAAGFDIRPIPVKARWLTQLLAQSGSADDSQVLMAAEACVKLAEEAAAGGYAAEATDVLDAAKRLLIKAVAKAQLAARTAKAALARSQSPADNAELKKNADAAQAAWDGLKSAQARLNVTAKKLQAARHEQEAIAAARELLKTSPDDPDACGTVGRWLCFHQGDWAEGLKLLAKSSDDVLKPLAEAELGPKPAGADDKVARGNAWWDLADKADGEAKTAMRQRAAQWYQDALPELAQGLGKSLVEKRLSESPAAPPGTPPTGGVPSANLPVGGFVDADGNWRIPPGAPRPAIAPFNAAQARAHQEEWARYLGVPVEFTNSIGMAFALVPPGEYLMGSPDADPRLRGRQKPQHMVKISKAFYLATHTVTVGQFRAFIEATGYRTRPEVGLGGVFQIPGKRSVRNPEYTWRTPPFQQNDRHPVVFITWSDTNRFCRWLAEKENAEYRLPTEGEWEYACRAGTTTNYYWGDDVEAYPTYGNIADREFKSVYPSAINTIAGSDGFANTAPVGSFKPNAFGLYDMLGNVRQICSDFFASGDTSSAPEIDPHGPETGPAHMVRGCAFSDVPGDVQVSKRSTLIPSTATAQVGFRMVVEMKPAAGK